MADKGDTYYCTWKREADGTCVGWEIRCPKLQAKAATPRELMGALGKVVGEYYDDHEAAMHFDPPLSEAGDPAWFAEDLLEISWNAAFHFRPSATSAYANGRCKRCGAGLGERATTSLEVDEMDDRADGAFSPGSNEPPPSYGMPGRLKIISGSFLESLSDSERRTFAARHVKFTEQLRLQFFEPTPHAFIPLGAIKGLEVTGWRCDVCNRRCYGNFSLGTCVRVACRQSLPKDSPEFFFAGNDKDIHLFCSRRRWKEMAGKKWARKLTGERLAVVDQSQFDTDPLLGTLDEIAAFRKKYGFKVPFKPSPR
ncbi:MAG TPA: hypothetical protein VFW23_13330 [Tepidisphaeraceae bacterium]|nr:hypothetical protein [Tepidisphaeraceae bacterium]